MADWGPATGYYGHNLSPLAVHKSLDALAGLKAVWADMAGSPYLHPETWQPHAPTLYTSGNFTLGISTAMGKTGASRVIQAFFGSEPLNNGITVGEDQTWSLHFSPQGSGSQWARDYFPLFSDFDWPGQSAGEAWPVPPDRWPAWGDPNLGGYPRPQQYGDDPLEAIFPVSLQAPLEEGGVLGWTHPLGVPAATMPKRTN